MLRLNESTRATLMMMHGFAMVGLGLGLFYIRTTMTNPLYDVIGSAFALLLAAASLLFIAVVDWICVIGLGSHQAYRLRVLLLLSTGAAGGGVFLIFYPNGTIRLLCYLIAVYALLLSIGKFRLARYWTRYWKGTKREQVAKYILACIAFFFCVLLVTVSGQSERDAIGVIAGYSIFVGLQMLLSLYYLQQQTLKPLGSASGPKKANI